MEDEIACESGGEKNANDRLTEIGHVTVMVDVTMGEECGEEATVIISESL